MEHRNLAKIIKNNTKKHSLRTAIVFRERKYSYNKAYRSTRIISNILKRKRVRKNDRADVRRLNVYPREIKEILYQNPHIKEAAVIGVPNIHKGEVPKDFVVLRENDNISEQDIIDYLKQRLALYKIPRKIEIRNSLPKNTAGKILKQTLSLEGKS